MSFASTVSTLTNPIEINTFEVKKNDWTDTRVHTTVFDGNLENDQVLFKIDRFALTANNISYFLAGDALGYWQFFPTADGYGRVPAMGYADVAASNHPEIKVGDRFWGFYPMSDYLIVQAGNVNASGFSDVVPYRQALAPLYSRFDNVKANPLYEETREDQDLLLRGLFLTSWLVDDFMFDNDYFGANSYVITCASSKTSIALAYTAQQRGETRRIGMTSEKNVEFCQNLGCYDEIITYDQAQTLDHNDRIMIVDMAGNFSAMQDLHEHFQDNVKYSCKVGATHQANQKDVDIESAIEGDMDSFPGATPKFFFAPAQAQKRTQDWGPGELQKRIGMSLKEYQIYSDQWMEIHRSKGLDDIASSFAKVVQDGISPSQGLILSV
jgi:hypothetical protein